MVENHFGHQFSSGQNLEICQGDITREETDAIVNAANSRLMHSGGVAAAIAQRGGEMIDHESREWVRLNGPVIHSKPAVTSGGNLKCKFAIHAVGPVWGEGDEINKLKGAITGCLNTAETLKVNSIAFPAIATGIFGFPKDRAAEIFMRSVRDYFLEFPLSVIGYVKIVLLDDIMMSIFITALINEFGNEKKK
jgi:O-acetyl-ADP-ribose deacetylase (regulator of RNase III)